MSYKMSYKMCSVLIITVLVVSNMLLCQLAIVNYNVIELIFLNLVLKTL